MIQKNKILKAVSEGIQSGFKFSSDQIANDNVDFNDAKINSVESLNLDAIYYKFMKALKTDVNEAEQIYETYGRQIIDTHLPFTCVVQDKTELKNILKFFNKKEFSGFDLGHITFDNTYCLELYYMFDNLKYFDCNINDWDVSKVTNMSYAFVKCESFNQPLDKWNTQNVKEMRGMFEGCSNFNQNINSWNTSNVDAMSYMFTDCKKFNQPLDNWDVSHVDTMYNMFNGCIEFNQNINNWDTSNVTNMGNMFKYCTSFEQPINNWNIEKVTIISQMFMSSGKYYYSYLPEFLMKNLNSNSNFIDFSIFANTTMYPDPEHTSIDDADINESTKTGFKFNNDIENDSSMIDFDDAKISHTESLNIDKLYKNFENAVKTRNFDLVDEYYKTYGFKYKVSNLRLLSTLFGYIQDREITGWLDIRDLLKKNKCFVSYIDQNNKKIAIDDWDYSQKPEYIEIEYSDKLTSRQGNSIMLKLNGFEKYFQSIHYWQNRQGAITECKDKDDEHQIRQYGYDEFLRVRDIDGYDNTKQIMYNVSKKSDILRWGIDNVISAVATTNMLSNDIKYESYLPSIGQMLYLADLIQFVNVELKKTTGHYILDVEFWTSSEYDEDHALSINNIFYQDEYQISAELKVKQHYCLPFFRKRT